MKSNKKMKYISLQTFIDTAETLQNKEGNAVTHSVIICKNNNSKKVTIFQNILYYFFDKKKGIHCINVEL